MNAGTLYTIAGTTGADYDNIASVTSELGALEACNPQCGTSRRPFHYLIDFDWSSFEMKYIIFALISFVLFGSG